jgi:hypothetical protein
MITQLSTQAPKRVISVRTADAAAHRVKPEFKTVCSIMRWRYGLRWHMRPYLNNPFAE